ncbi:ATP-grasp domain-containing protein [Aeromicrobium tamlense]|uniref:ATP-grasp domain-containing protein n=1 Tax=Aeromicrobium tamlense TaxID=375541 RepID=A0A8I0KKS3_9ACTN|nr:biotin carboxylase N-terminal domain-containing protein [Aeromicrobium tamlense]MBD1269213.1 ATP-grasp domain-containing protein [Aeromicrobium tamlense]NYI36878.1 acetyl-CoA carboxylase biotin carboxylase subunit [Aeromicrobium tamlense]
MSVVFIANRGEIAARILRTVREQGHRGAVAFPEVDADLPYVGAADITVELSGPRDFGDVEAMVAAARSAGAELVHPGYGFLSEKAAFARAVEAAGMVFVGPSPDVIELMGDKAGARAAAVRAGLSVAPGSDGAVETVEEARAAADAAGYPVMLKAVAGGGGIGMSVVRDADALDAAFETVTSRAGSVFGDRRVIVERYLERSRHIEVQVMGLPDGRAVALSERDCSVQRRHQKVVEEAPSPALDAASRASLLERAAALTEAVGYVGAGTIEFIHDLDSGESYFLEMNTRLQVEHPVTEAVHDVDLVAWQLRIASGDSTVPAFHAEPRGHAIEVRLYAEDSERFLPRPGAIETWEMPSGEGVRVDSGYAPGTKVTPFFDPLLAKVIVWGRDRDEALERARDAMDRTTIVGPGSNVEFLRRVLAEPEFVGATHDTGIVGRMTSAAVR